LSSTGSRGSPIAPEGAETADATAHIPPATLDGWLTLHQLFRFDVPSMKHCPAPDARRAAGELDSWNSIEIAAADGGGWSGLYACAGSGCDLMAVHFRNSFEQLVRAGRELRATEALSFGELDAEYLSVVELGLYGLTNSVVESADGADAWEERLREEVSRQERLPRVWERLHPVQPPGMPCVCVYPMDKRREAARNWYALPLAERARLMMAHGAIGRKHAGRIAQVIGGSTGLGDWEWVVTLWADDPLNFKQIVAEMRYDAASAEYAEFGPFVVGERLGKGAAGQLFPALTTR